MAKTATIDKAQAAYEKACKQLDRPVKPLGDFIVFYGEEEGPAFFSLYRITTVIKASKKGKKLDFGDLSQGKYYPWKRFVPGSGFRLDAVGFACDCSYVGARLSSPTDKDAREISELMAPDYDKWFIE